MTTSNQEYEIKRGGGGGAGRDVEDGGRGLKCEILIFDHAIGTGTISDSLAKIYIFDLC